MSNTGDGDIIWTPASQYVIDPQGPYPGGGTKYDHAAGALAAYTAPSGEFWMRLNDGYWYRHTAPGLDHNGQPDNGVWDLTRRWNDADAARLGYAPSVRINDPTDHPGGIDLGMVATFFSIAAAGGAFSGMLAPGGATGAVSETAAMDAWLGSDIAIESASTAATSATATTGASSMSDIGNLSGWLDSYSSDPGIDPFATTADVNAGWSYDGGYPAADWYNSAGVGEAPSFWQSLNTSATEASKLVKTIGGALSSGSAAVTQARNNLSQQQPNYTRAAGSVNLGLLAVAALAWKLL